VVFLSSYPYIVLSSTKREIRGALGRKVSPHERMSVHKGKRDNYGVVGNNGVVSVQSPTLNMHDGKNIMAPSQNQTCPQVDIKRSDPKRCLSGPLAHAEKNGKVEIELALKSSA
jgi:hypothetical protein